MARIALERIKFGRNTRASRWTASACDVFRKYWPAQATPLLTRHNHINRRPQCLVHLWLCCVPLCGLPTAASAQQPSIDILHLWRTKSEQRAVSVLRSQAIADGAQWREVGVSGFSAVKEEFAKRKAINHPPNVVAWPLGRELNVMTSTGLTRRITDQGGFFESQLDPEIFKLVATDQGLSAIPLGLHIQNHIVLNQDLLTKYAFERPKTWAQFISYGPRLKDDGIYLISNSDEPWQIRNMFMSIFSSLASASEVRDLLSGDTSALTMKSKFTAGLAIFSNLKGFAEPGFHNRKWENTVRSLEGQRVLAVLLGDYIIPEFNEATNIVCDLAPGANYVLWGADTLIFPVQPNEPQRIAGQDLLVKLLSNRDTLIEFARWKGSIPAIKNVPLEGMHPCTAYMHDKWQTVPDKALADADSWNRRLAALGFVLNSIWNNEKIDIDAAADRIVKVLDAIR